MFTLMHAYYTGALVMYFASDPPEPFGTLDDGLRNDWNFVYQGFMELSIATLELVSYHINVLV